MDIEAKRQALRMIPYGMFVLTTKTGDTMHSHCQVSVGTTLASELDSSVNEWRATGSLPGSAPRCLRKKS